MRKGDWLVDLDAYGSSRQAWFSFGLVRGRQALKILLYQDATLTLPLSELVAQISSRTPLLDVRTGSIPFSVAGRIVSAPEAYDTMPAPLKEELRDSQLAMLLTAKRYDNNFFWIMEGSSAILSFAGWSDLTDLPVENGVVLFLASKIIDSMDIGFDHDENTGCINDFLWDKSHVDNLLRTAYLCAQCRRSLDRLSVNQISLLEQAEYLMDDVVLASRRHSSIIDFWRSKSSEDAAFDTFLCHNSKDKPEVQKLSSRLKAVGLRPWLDEEQLRPGSIWQEELEHQIDNIASATVCVGSSGVGPWQNLELRGLLSVFTEKGRPIIPLILPDAQSVPPLPLFLRQLMWVDFRRTTPDPIDQLRWGITGRRP